MSGSATINATSPVSMDNISVTFLIVVWISTTSTFISSTAFVSSSSLWWWFSLISSIFSCMSSTACL